MSADTVTVSPTQRLAANLPLSTAGSGYWITIRGTACSGAGETSAAWGLVAVEAMCRKYPFLRIG
jgi:hypothetical protein